MITGTAAGSLLLLVWMASASAGEASPLTPARHAHGDLATPARQALLEVAERALAAGEVELASSTLETAAGLAHAADTELLQIRTMMQAGGYRQAANYAAHTAGIHLDEMLAPALYAWLLELGGQGQHARRMLTEAMARAPANAVATEVHALLDDPTRPLPAMLFKAPHRFAPYAAQVAGPPPPQDVALAANGTLWDNGRRALVPIGVVAGAGRIWVRNGLGQTTSATRARDLPTVGLSVLTLAAPLSPGPVTWAARDAFAGSPGFVVAYPAVASGAPPLWPRLVPGFLGSASATSESRRLGIALPAGPRGGPVFDKFGQVVGISLAMIDGDSCLTVSQIRRALGEAEAALEPLSPTPRVTALDEGYEHALYAALQVIVTPSAR